MNDLAKIAAQLPRDPDKEMIMLLKREGACSSVKFSPYKVNRALRWLVEHNPIYHELYKEGKIHLGDFAEGEEKEVPITVQLTEEEEEAMMGTVNDTTTNSTIHSAQSDVVLLDIPCEITSKEEDVRSKLHMKEKAEDTKGPLHVTEKGDYVAHWQDPTFFDAKAFPHLFPYGCGGLSQGEHGLKDAELVRLHLMRGDDRRFQNSMSYIFTQYTRQTRKEAGGVAIRASETLGFGNQSANERGDLTSSLGGISESVFGRDIVLGDPISELQCCSNADELLATLEKDDGKLLRKLLSRLEPFSRGLAGSSLHIAYERKQLLAMLTSRIVSASGMLTIFGTNAPCDRWNPELYDIVDPRALTPQERAVILRAHPVLAARIFNARVTALFKHIYEGEAQPFGKVTDHWIRVEFQGQSSLFLCSQPFLQRYLTEKKHDM